MTSTSNDLVIIGDCANEIEAKLLKGYFESNDIFCHIQGESHRALMGMMGGFIHLNIMVPENQAEEAKMLLDDFRSHDSQFTELEIPIDEIIPKTKETPTTPKKPVTRYKPLAQENSRKRLGIAMLLALFVTFGTGHLYVRETFTFIVLALLQVTGIMFYLLNYTGTFVPILIFGPIVFDFIDSVRIAKQGKFKSEWD